MTKTHHRRGAAHRRRARCREGRAWRFAPLLTAGFYVAYRDRVNVGFAALTMNKEFGFSPEF